MSGKSNGEAPLRFELLGEETYESRATDRQERITWWDQRAVGAAKIMVVGAGAIGNETLKNLALLGFRYLFVTDFDTVSLSNLSRTVLFRREDIGLRKAEVAARRVKEMAVAEDFQIDWFHGDVVRELGVGVYQEMSLVLGCLDNIETRLAVNRQCWLAGVPWIDAGIRELTCRVNMYCPPRAPCFECGVSAADRDAARRRYSCDDFKRAASSEGKVPTVQVASAIASALQVQEAVKFLCHQTGAQGRKLYFEGKWNDFDSLELLPREDCEAHQLSYPPLIPLRLSHGDTVRLLLEVVSVPERSGPGAVLTLSGQHKFIESGSCQRCGREIRFRRPAFRIDAAERICSECRAGDASSKAPANKPEVPMAIREHPDFSLATTPPDLLDLSLHEIGLGYYAAVVVRDPNSQYFYYRLDGDRKFILPSLAVDHRSESIVKPPAEETL